MRPSQTDPSKFTSPEWDWGIEKYWARPAQHSFKQSNLLEVCSVTLQAERAAIFSVFNGTCSRAFQIAVMQASRFCGVDSEESEYMARQAFARCFRTGS